MNAQSRSKRITSGSTVAALVAATMLAVVLNSAGPAAAAVPPVPAAVAQPTANNVTADALPTVQIDGVVWSQAIVGNTVYAGGQFTKARPAGAAAGVNTTARSNLLSYNLTTGALITTFAPSVNGVIKAVAASPDGTRLYIGGSFTTADGAARSRIAAYNTATGALVTTFKPVMSNTVNALVATNTTVYAGGAFTTAAGVARGRLAAFNAADGALTAWNPSADAGVNAMVRTPDGSRIIVGGAFQNISAQAEYGLAAVDATSGQVLPWAANQAVRDAGSQAAILSLSTDGTAVYGTGYVYGAGGNFEGTFSADPDSGTINWLEDCHGDTYGAYGMNGVVYTVSHAHYCATVGGYPQSDSNWAINMRHALAFTSTAQGTLGHNAYGGYTDWYGNPAPALYNWFPDFTVGTFTGQSQAAWTVTGNGQYVVMGGEFPSVNGTGQQGLVRFAVRPPAPGTQAPRLSGAGFVPSLAATSTHSVRVAWQANWDRDDENLTYKVFRNNGTTPVYTTTATSQFWNRPTMGFVDTGLTPGASYTYKVYALDPAGNTAPGSNVSITMPTADPSPYVQDVLNDGASDYWRLGESSGTTGADLAGFNNLVEGSTVGHGAAGAIGGDTNTASTFDGTATGTAGSTNSMAGPNTFTVETWIKTTTTQGGKIVGFGNAQSGDSSGYDRHVYMDNAGHIYFGVYPNAVRTLNTSGTYNDGQWHYIVASLSSAGMVLYVDGKQIARDAGTTVGQDYSGYWRVGGDNLGSWPAQPTSENFAGTIDDTSVYPTALTIAQVRKHYTDSGRTLNIPPAPTDNYGKQVYNDNPDLYWRLDDASGPTAADASANGAPGVYSGGVTYQTPSTVTGPSGTGVTLDGNDGAIGAQQPTTGPSVYSEDLWFKTTTGSGGKLIGFGDQQSGLSSNYDRHVFMLDSGQLVFGVWTGQANTITTADSYNDGTWHQVVATQGGDGMALYIDGALVGTDPQTQAQAYTGYWRVGGDNDWGGSSRYFAGSIDEVSVYSAELTPAQIQAQYAAATGTTPPPNQAPTAAFTWSCPTMTCAFDGSTSSDDGTVASYAWDFGDGSPAGTGPTPSHTYTTTGAHTVTLTVTDDQGATSAPVTHSVTPTAPANQAPTAVFTQSCTNLVCAFDGSTSSDPDGSVASYSWNFGDGTAAGTGASPSHTYASTGTRTVTLTVTDNQGATNATSHSVTVASGTTTLAADAFNRTVSNAWGTADTGGAWAVSGSAASYSVAAGVAKMVMAKGATQTAYLNGTTAGDSNSVVDFTFDKAQAGSSYSYAYLAARHAGTSLYRLRAKLLPSAIQLSLTKTVSGTESVLATSNIAGLTMTPGHYLRLRFQVSGTSSVALAGKIWTVGAAEPTAVQVKFTDTTNALGAGGLGLAAYLSSAATNAPVTASFANYSVTGP